MRHLDVTLPLPAENLALDEALLDESDGPSALRTWESQQPFVVLGRSSRWRDEVSDDALNAGVPVLRRISGGASIVTGPGCLMYAVVLPLPNEHGVVDVPTAHRFVLGRLAEALRGIDASVVTAGTSDLAVERDGVLMKFSGNSVRVTRKRLLYHGTLLRDFDLSQIASLLRSPPRQPDYRGQRDHSTFVRNLSTCRDALLSAVAAAFGSRHAVPSVPSPELISAAQQLAARKYQDSQWNLSR